MIAGLILEIFGGALALAGMGYTVLAVLWITRAYKRWPRASMWATIGTTAILGLGATLATKSGVIGAAAVLACVCMAWRGRRVLLSAHSSIAPKRGNAARPAG